ncbi:vegetative incompatibility het-e-1 [Fusarium mexicanum]|uniref:Vegetative incompatibility het-e-1 n=1 Tax=Fusarium mexicanum TaxID=751941 RepID=A0A8H5MJG2_9HYPO|nr:vegetative incompatibility het-e-1 [Fusarium mexicanum]
MFTASAQAAAVHNQVLGSQEVKGDQVFNFLLNNDTDSLISLPIAYEARYDSKDLEEHPKCHEDTRNHVRSIIRSQVLDLKAKSLIWLHAPAGTGKSTLARTLVNDFRQENRLAAGYFFRRGDELRNDTCRIFSTITSQLIETIPDYPNALRQSLDSLTIQGLEKMALSKQFEILIFNPLNTLNPKNGRFPRIIIIDALDECTRPKDIPLLLQKFASLEQIKALRLCVLFTSRRVPPYPGLCQTIALHEDFKKETRSEIEIVLSHGLTEICQKRFIERQSWPSSEQYDIIVRHATHPFPLFVYISTLLRYISKRDPVRRLEDWISNRLVSVKQLDQMYVPIMKAVLNGEWEEDGTPEPLNGGECTELRHILGSLVLLTKPLTRKALSSLLEMRESSVNGWLKSLHAVIHVSDDEGSPVELIHKSFADFLLADAGEVSDPLRINASDIHGFLAERCTSRMLQGRRIGLPLPGLQKNLCMLPKPTTRTGDIDRDQVAANIPDDLEYACVYWVHHLVRSEKGVDWEIIYTFFTKHVLHWFEALSILKELPEGGAAIRKLLNLLSSCKTEYERRDSLSELLSDAQKFIQDHGTTIQEYPLQTYGASLVLSDPRNTVKRLAMECQEMRMASIRSIRGGLIARERALVSEFIEPQRPSPLAISPDGCLVAATAPSNLCLIDISTGIVIRRFPYDQPRRYSFLAVAFSEDQRIITAVTQEKEVFVWDTIQSPEELTRRHVLVTCEKYFKSCAICAKDSLIATLSGDSMLRLWDFETGCHRQTISNVVLDGGTDISLRALSDTEFTIALIKASGEIYLLNVCGKTEPVTVFVGVHGCLDYCQAVTISPCGNLLTSWSSDEIWVWVRDQGQISHRHTIKCVGDSPGMNVAFFPNSEMIAAGASVLSIFHLPLQSGCRRGGKPELLAVHDDITPPPLYISNLDRIMKMVIALDGKTLATVNYDCALSIWDLEEGSLKQTITGEFEWTHELAISSNGNMLATELKSQELGLWRLQGTTATFVNIVDIVGTTYWIAKIDFSPGPNAKCHNRVYSGNNRYENRVLPKHGQLGRTLSDDI